MEKEVILINIIEFELNIIETLKKELETKDAQILLFAAEKIEYEAKNERNPGKKV